MDQREKCSCVSKHVPLPLRLYSLNVEGAELYLCPTAFDNLESLRIEYSRHGGEPPGSVRKHYGDYIQQLARQLENSVE